jgi:hypothetical protein
MARDVLLVGSVPLRPAAAVFEALAGEIGSHVVRMPDGDQHGWIMAVLRSLRTNASLEQIGRVALSVGGAEIPRFAPRHGVSAGDLALGPYGFATAAAVSYREFRRLRDAGVVPANVRLQITMPGPGTSAYMVRLPPEDLLPVARQALAREVDELVRNVAPEELTVQLDIAMEAEHEEYRRNPDAFETPVHATFDWTLEQMAESVAWLADRVPPAAELGFHICSIWHHYQPGGQDNAVLVDVVNAIARRVNRPIGYFHLPTIPEHDVDDFRPLRELCVASDTRIYLGVIHQSDGLEGAKRRIAAARISLPDFGVAAFCGLGNPAVLEDSTGAITVGEALHEEVRPTGPLALARTLALHREVAELP